MTARDPEQPLGGRPFIRAMAKVMTHSLIYRCTRIASLVLVIASFIAANLVNASESDVEHHLSIGPLRSDEYYWVPTEAPYAEYDSNIQDKAIKHLEACRLFQKIKHADRMLILSEAEEEIRICMRRNGLTRRWTKPHVII